MNLVYRHFLDPHFAWVLGRRCSKLGQKSPAEWGVINLRTVMAAAEAIVAKYDRKKLPRHEEHIEITKHYAKSLLRKMGLVKRHKSR